MADISRIQDLTGTIYDLKDAAAREEVLDIRRELKQNYTELQGNLLPEFCDFPTRSGTPSKPITVVWNENKTSATISNVESVNYDNYIGLYDPIEFVMPDVMDYGTEYTIHYSTTDPNVTLCIDQNGSETDYTDDATLTITEGQGFSLSIKVASNAVVNAIITLNMPSKVTIANLQKEVKDISESSYINLLQYFCSYANVDTPSFQLTWNDAKTMLTVHGDATPEVNSCVWLSRQQELPACLIPGKTYHVKMSSDLGGQNALLRLRWYYGEEAWTDEDDISSDTDVYVPLEVTHIRLFIVLPFNASLHGTVSVEMVGGLSDAYNALKDVHDTAVSIESFKGGQLGYYLKKNSASDYDVAWDTIETSDVRRIISRTPAIEPNVYFTTYYYNPSQVIPYYTDVNLDTDPVTLTGYTTSEIMNVPDVLYDYMNNFPCKVTITWEYDYSTYQTYATVRYYKIYGVNSVFTPLETELARIDAEVGTKVDSIDGKGLSTNDYTTAEKTKLSGIEAQANKTVLDGTLTQTGQAADAKAVGDAIANFNGGESGNFLKKNTSTNLDVAWDMIKTDEVLRVVDRTVAEESTVYKTVSIDYYAGQTFTYYTGTSINGLDVVLTGQETGTVTDNGGWIIVNAPDTYYDYYNSIPCKVTREIVTSPIAGWVLKFYRLTVNEITETLESELSALEARVTALESRVAALES